MFLWTKKWCGGGGGGRVRAQAESFCEGGVWISAQHRKSDHQLFRGDRSNSRSIVFVSANGTAPSGRGVGSLRLKPSQPMGGEVLFRLR